ncbi:DUF2079 domain-containing protein [Synechococcus lacustris Tous-12m]
MIGALIFTSRRAAPSSIGSQGPGRIKRILALRCSNGPPGADPSAACLSGNSFFVFGFGLQLWRLEGFSASYDQGLFLQELWSGSQGRWFESTLSAELSAAVKLGGNCPSWAICMPASTSIC